MDTNIVRDITDIYFEQIVLDESKKAKPDYLDFDGDGDEEEPMKKALRDRVKAKVEEELTGNQGVLDKAPPYGKLTSADFKELRKGKKKIKEGFSNWREDLIEVADKIKSNKSEEIKVVEKSVNNKIDINPKLDLGEAIESLGGTLLEMSEIEDFEGVFDELTESEIFFLTDDLIEQVVEQVFLDCLDEGYNLLDVENILIESIETSSAILTEAEVTYGHDTDIKKDRLERVKSAVKKVGKGIARGAGYAAGLAVRGAKAVGRELKGGYQRGRYGSSGSQDSEESSGETTSSQGSGGDSQDSGETKKPGLLSRIASKLGRGLKKVIHKGAKAVERAAGSVARRTSDRPTVTQGRGVERQDTSSRVTQGRGDSEPQDASSRVTQGGGSSETQSSQPRPQTRTTAVSSRPSSESDQKKKARALRLIRQNPNISPEDLQRALGEEHEEEFELDEKVLTAAETKKKERIFKSMKPKAADFEKRYPGRGEDVMWATATKMAKKIAEQTIDEAKLSKTERRARNAEKPDTPKRPKHVVQLDLDQAALREVGSKKIRDPKTGKKQTTKVEPAKINVKGPKGDVVRTVSTGDFHKEKLGQGETMDFSPLRDPKKFTQTTRANKNVINKARGAVVEPNTARGAFRREEFSLEESDGKVDNKSVVQHLRNIGFNRKRGIEVKPGHFTGDMPGSGSPGKKLIATKHDIEKYKPEKMSHIDDDPKNLEPLEKHRQETQGKKGETKGSDPKIHTQLVGSFRKRGESRAEPREHGKVRRYSGVREPGSVTAPVSTREVQRRRQKARRGMGESLDIDTES